MNNNTNNGLTVTYNEKRVDEFLSYYDSIRNEFSEVDDMLYRTVINLSQSEGFYDVTSGNSSIDITMPERMVVQCREKAQNILDQVSYFKQEIDTLSGKAVKQKSETQTTPPTQPETTPENEEGNTEKKRLGKIADQQVLYGPAPTPTSINIDEPVLYGPGPTPTETARILDPVVYGPAPTPTETARILDPVLYGPGPTPTETARILDPVVYGPAPTPTETARILDPVLYGPGPTPTETTRILDPVVYGPAPYVKTIAPEPALYGPAPYVETSAPVTTPGGSEEQYRIYNPIGGQGSADVTTTTTTVGTAPTTPQYSAIPDTAVDMKKNIDINGAAAAGIGTGLLSLAAARKIRKKKEEQENNDEKELEEFEEI